jgi:hypothetical protein
MDFPDMGSDPNHIDWDKVRQYHLAQTYQMIPQDVINNRPSVPTPGYQDEEYSFDHPMYTNMARELASTHTLNGFNPWAEFGGSRGIRRIGWELLGKTPKRGEFPDPHLNREDSWNYPYSRRTLANAAYSLMKGIKLGDIMQDAHYRGIMKPDQGKRFLDRVRPGYTFDMPMASFVKDPEVAQGYGNTYRFRLSPGARGLYGPENIAGVDKAPAYEMVTGGKFRVDGVDPGDVTTIHISQQGTYDPDELIDRLNRPKVAAREDLVLVVNNEIPQGRHVDLGDLDEIFDGPAYVRDEPNNTIQNIHGVDPKTSSVVPSFVRTAVTMVPGDEKYRFVGFPVPEGPFLSHAVQVRDPQGNLLSSAEISREEGFDLPGTAFVNSIHSPVKGQGHATRLLEHLEQQGVQPTWDYGGNSPEGDAFIDYYESRRGRPGRTASAASMPDFVRKVSSKAPGRHFVRSANEETMSLEDLRNLQALDYGVPVSEVVPAMVNEYRNGTDTQRRSWVDNGGPEGYLSKLKEDIGRNGMAEPISIGIHPKLGPVVYDGTHRAVVADQLGLDPVPVKRFQMVRGEHYASKPDEFVRSSQVAGKK